MKRPPLRHRPSFATNQAAGNITINFSNGSEGWTWASDRPTQSSLPVQTGNEYAVPNIACTLAK